jgi:hypothetical protein
MSGVSSHSGFIDADPIAAGIAVAAAVAMALAYVAKRGRR